MISKICNWLGGIPTDKVLHFVVAYILFDILVTVITKCSVSTIDSILISFLIVSACIFAKETIDKYSYDLFDWYDVLAGYLGMMAKLILLVIFIL